MQKNSGRDREVFEKKGGEMRRASRCFNGGGTKYFDGSASRVEVVLGVTR